MTKALVRIEIGVSQEMLGWKLPTYWKLWKMVNVVNSIFLNREVYV